MNTNIYTHTLSKKTSLVGKQEHIDEMVPSSQTFVHTVCVEEHVTSRATSLEPKAIFFNSRVNLLNGQLNMRSQTKG